MICGECREIILSQPVYDDQKGFLHASCKVLRDLEAQQTRSRGVGHNYYLKVKYPFGVRTWGKGQSTKP